MTNNEQDNLRQSIEALQDFWSNHENYDIREKAREYIDLYQSNGNSDHFSWVHPEDAPYVNANICKAIRWGIPNQIIGDIEKAKFVIGLINPGTQISTLAGNQCDNITEYVTAEQAEENNTGVNNVHFESKEYSENPDFYLEHVISNENIMSLELKKLYKIFKQDSSAFFSTNNNGEIVYDKKMIEKVAYYLFAYYSKAFSEEGKYKSAIQNAIDYYYNLFEKIERSKVIVNEKSLNYDVEQAFNQAVESMLICNVEVFPYRSNGSGDIKIKGGENKKDLSVLISNSYISDLVIEKLMHDKSTVAIFRSFSTLWERPLKNGMEKRNLLLEDYKDTSIFRLKNDQNAGFSKGNIIIYGSSSKESQNKVDTVVDDLLEELKMQPFVDELNEIIEENS